LQGVVEVVAGLVEAAAQEVCGQLLLQLAAVGH
jgi:hypothetical protein